MDKKIENTFSKAQEQIAKLQSAFRQGGGLERALMKEGADIAAIARASRALSTALAEMAKVTGKTTLTEGVLDGDDEDGFMARSQLYFMARDAISLHGMIGDRDNLEPWVQAKITAAAEGIDAVRRYTEYKQVKAAEPAPVAAPEMAEDASPIGSAPLEQAAQLVIVGDWAALKDLLMSMDPASREDIIRTVADQEPEGFGTMFPDQESLSSCVSEARITEFAPLLGTVVARLGAGTIARTAAGAAASALAGDGGDTQDEKPTNWDKMLNATPDAEDAATDVDEVAKNMVGNIRKMAERKLTKGEVKKRDEYADKLPDAEFKKRYGKDADSVKYGTATNMAKKGK